MARRRLTELETQVLLAVRHAGEEAYGVPILEQLQERAGRRVLRPVVYETLRRLEGKGMVRSRLGEPIPERGGRARRYYTVTTTGHETLQSAHRAWLRLWGDLGDPVDES